MGKVNEPGSARGGAAAIGPAAPRLHGPGRNRGWAATAATVARLRARAVFGPAAHPTRDAPARPFPRFRSARSPDQRRGESPPGAAEARRRRPGMTGRMSDEVQHGPGDEGMGARLAPGHGSFRPKRRTGLSASKEFLDARGRRVWQINRGRWASVRAKKNGEVEWANRQLKKSKGGQIPMSEIRRRYSLAQSITGSRLLSREKTKPTGENVPISPWFIPLAPTRPGREPKKTPEAVASGVG